ncbi:MAG: hypothetical protein ABI645_11895 [Pseudomonadota bacterium]
MNKQELHAQRPGTGFRPLGTRPFERCSGNHAGKLWQGGWFESPIRTGHRYLGDPEAAKAVADVVRRQTEKR